MGIFVPVLVNGDVWDAENQSRRTIFIRVGRLVRRVTWHTGTMRDLQLLVCSEFNAPVDLVQVRAKQNDANPFILFHSEYAKGYVDAAPLVWPDADLSDGSVVSVRDPLWQAALTLCAGEGDSVRRRRKKNRTETGAPPLTPPGTGLRGLQRTSKDFNTHESEMSGSEMESVSTSNAGWFGGNDAAPPQVVSQPAHSSGMRLLQNLFSSKKVDGVSGGRSRQNLSHGDMPPKLINKLIHRAALVSNLDDLTSKERMDVLLNDPGSSTSAATIGGFMIALIALSTTTFCMETLPWFYDPNPPLSDPFWAIEAFCIAAFTLELSCRVWSTEHRVSFFRKGMNQIDAVAIIPFYIDLIARGVTIPGLSMLRVLRLARVFRLLRVSKNAVALLGETMSRSAQPLYILCFLLSMALITFSAVLYFAERGSFDLTQNVWMRKVGYECDFPCTDDTRKWTQGYVACGGDSGVGGTVGTGYFDKIRPDAESVATTCAAVHEQSPFQSILHAIWWAVATMGTVGYGDLVPRTVLGCVLAAVAQMLGILVLALPITVIGSNFSAIYSSIGTSQSLGAKEHEPSLAVQPLRLHASSAGATTTKITRGWVGPLAHDWDLDVAVAELTPCQPSVVKNVKHSVEKAPQADVATGSGGSLRWKNTVAKSASGARLRRLNLTPEEQRRRFVDGESLFEAVGWGRSGGGSACSSIRNSLNASPRASGVVATPFGSSENLTGAGGPDKKDAPLADKKNGGPASSEDSPPTMSRLGTQSLHTALADAKRAIEETDRRAETETDEETVPRLHYEPPPVARRSGKARRAALVILVHAFLNDCVRNPEIKDKFAATRQRETLRKGDSLFSKDEDGDGTKNKKEVKNEAAKKTVFAKSRTLARRSNR